MDVIDEILKANDGKPYPLGEELTLPVMVEREVKLSGGTPFGAMSDRIERILRDKMRRKK